MGMRLILEKTVLVSSMSIGNCCAILYSGVTSILPDPPDAAAAWAPSPSDAGAASSAVSLEHAAATRDRASRVTAVIA